MKKRRWNNKDREAFIKVLADSGNVSEAARHVLHSRKSAYDQRKTHEDFAQAWEEAEAVAADAIDQEIRRRGIEGWEEPVFYQGKVAGHIRKYSDQMLALLAKAHHPAYRDIQRLEHTGKDGAPIEHSIGAKDELTTRITNLIGRRTSNASDPGDERDASGGDPP